MFGGFDVAFVFGAMVVACGYCFVCLCNCFIGWFVDLMGDVC